MPASRRTSASAMVVTPSSRAPAESAVRATSTAPWLYPSALMTAINAASPANSRRTRTLCAIASRSTTASVCGPTASSSRLAFPSAGSFGALPWASVMATILPPTQNRTRVRV